MNKIAILYASVHHSNTKKLVEGIALKCNVDLFNVIEEKDIDLSSYSIVGYASGIYMATYHKAIIDFIERNNELPGSAFLMHTSGSGNKKYSESVKRKLELKNINIIGQFHCKGYDTYGIWKLVGGISKKHPSEKDIDNGIEFINKMNNNLKKNIN